MCIPVVPARGGAEVALKIYIRLFSSIELACAVRQPSRACVHSAKVVSSFTCHIWSSTSHFTLHTSHFPLHSSHFTLHTSRFTVHTSHLKLHSPHFTLLTAFFTFHIPHFTLHSSRPTLHTALFTRHTLSHLSSSHLIPSHFFSSHHLFSYVMQAFMNHFPVLLLRNLHAPCASQARACVLCAKLLQCCCPRRWPARDPGAMQTLSSQFTLHSSHPTLHTSHLHFISTHLIWALLISFHVFPYVS